MKIKFIAIAALTLTAFANAPARAQSLSKLEAQDALFIACMEARGWTDWASVVCYRAAYGSETSGGGPSNYINLPGPSNDCRGREFECSFGTRPQ